jgi:hypothetical protein
MSLSHSRHPDDANGMRQARFPFPRIGEEQGALPLQAPVLL